MNALPTTGTPPVPTDPPVIMVLPGPLVLSLLCFVIAGQFYNKQVTKRLARGVGDALLKLRVRI